MSTGFREPITRPLPPEAYIEDGFIVLGDEAWLVDEWNRYGPNPEGRIGPEVAYRAKNKERIRVKNKVWRGRNREKRLADHRAWREANKVTIAEKKRIYDAAHREEITRRQAIWRAANPEKARAQDRQYRRASRARDPEKARAQDRAQYARRKAKRTFTNQRHATYSPDHAEAPTR